MDNNRTFLNLILPFGVYMPSISSIRKIKFEKRILFFLLTPIINVKVEDMLNDLFGAEYGAV